MAIKAALRGGLSTPCLLSNTAIKAASRWTVPWVETECVDDGSQTCVTPAEAMSSTFPIRRLYHPPLCFHDSQLNACTIIDGRLIQTRKFNRQIILPRIESIRIECVGYLEQDLAGRQSQEKEQAQAAEVPVPHCSLSLSVPAPVPLPLSTLRMRMDE